MSEQRALGEQFITLFKAKKAEIDFTLASQKSGPNTSKDLDAIQTQIAALRAELTENLELLTSYDQRQLDLQLKTLEKQVHDMRAVKPQGKFSFKRAKPKAEPAQPSPASEGSTPAAPANPASSSGAAQVWSGNTISNLSRTCVTPSSLLSQAGDLQLSSLNDTLVNLVSSASSPPTAYRSVHAKNLTHSVLLLPDIPGSVFLEGCDQCLVVVGCHQFRMHKANDTVVLLSVKSVPIIEDCSGIRVGAYPAALQSSLRTEDPTFESQHAGMRDFDWLVPGASPNWKLMSAEESKQYEALTHRLLQVPPGNIEEKILDL